MFHGNLQTTHAVTKTVGCSLQTDSKAALVRTTPTQHIQHGEFKVGSYLDPSTLCSSIFGRERYPEGYQKRNINTNPATKPLIYNAVLPAKYSRAMMEQIS